MPFRECSIMSEREEFCRLWERGGVSVRDLCRRFCVSPTTGYKWRALAGGGAFRSGAGARSASVLPYTNYFTPPVEEAHVLAGRRCQF